MGATAGRPTARREGGGEKTRELREDREDANLFSVCAPRPLGPAAWKLRGMSCEKESDGKILLMTALAFSLWRMKPRF